MSIYRLFRSLTLILLVAGLPFITLAATPTPISMKSDTDFYQDRRGKKQEGGKDRRKSEVKEVPQSRRQEKPGEVKQDKKEKARDSKRKN